MLRGLHHVSISTPDLPRLLAFYRDLLGFEVAAKGRWSEGDEQFDAVVGLKSSSAKVCFLKFGNAYLEIFQYATPDGRAPEPNRPPNACGITHLCIDVDDVDAEYARLVAAGVRFHCPPQILKGVAKTTYARDPDDNIVEFQQLLDLGAILRLPEVIS